MNLRNEIQESKDYLFLLLTSLLFFLLRLPSLFEPYWYGDEGIYHVIGAALRQGRLLYSGIWDNKPPLLYITYSIFNDQFAMRLVSLLIGLLTIVAFFYMARQLFLTKHSENKTQEEKMIYLSTLTFAILFGLPLLEGNIANSENFMLLPIIVAAILVLKFIQSRNPFLPLYSGFMLAIAFLYKIVAIFDLAAFSIILAITLTKKISLKSLLKTTQDILPLFIGFAIPLILTFIYFLIQGDILDFVNAVFRQNINYVGWGNKFFIPQGFLILKLAILGIWLTFIYVRKDKFSLAEIFIFTWIALATFNAFFSQRPYTHYMLVLLPSICLLFALTLKKHNQRVSLFLLVILIILLVKNFNFYKKTPFYYYNFLAFVIGSRDVPSYQAFFDRKTPNDYIMAQYINMHAQREDQLFVWGNNAQVYRLTDKLPPGRFTVLYHMSASQKTLEETKNVLEQAKPKYILLSSSKRATPFNLLDYIQRFSVGESILYERLF